MESAGLPLRRSGEFNSKLCIFCQKKEGKLTSGEVGCARIRSVAKERGDDILNVLKMLGEDAVFFYHMTNDCYRSYTLKSNVERYVRDNNKNYVEKMEEHSDEFSSDNEELTQRKTRSNLALQYRDCFVCNKTKKSEKTSILSRLSRIQEIRKVALTAKDEVLNRVAHFTNDNDMARANLRYHPSCLRKYEKAHGHKGKAGDVLHEFDDNVNERKHIERIENEELELNNNSIRESHQKIECIRTAVNSVMPEVKNGKAFSLSEICSQVNLFLAPHTSVRNIDIRNYLESNFGDSIQFHVPKAANKPTLFFDSSITTGDLMEKILSVDVIEESAKLIKDALNTLDFDLNDRFCDKHDLEHAWDNITIPPIVLKFFSKIFYFDVEEFTDVDGENESDTDDDLTSEDTTKRKAISKRKALRMKSLLQMMYFIKHGGKAKTPLHVLVAMGVHGTCKSATLIKILNRIGISVSYDEVQRIRNRLALYAVENSTEIMPIPCHVNSEKYTTAAFDNFDHNEATESGLNGSHDTVSVLFQDKPEVVKRKPKISETGITNWARTFDAELKCQELRDFPKPTNPITLPSQFPVNIRIGNVNTDSFDNFRIDDLVWNLCRIGVSTNDIETTLESPKIPSWSGFHSLVVNDERPTQVSAFTPVLPHPVTEFSTVNTALHNFNHILKQLDQRSLAVFADEGVYRIARHIQLISDEFNGIFLALGSFHMTKVLLACAGKYLRGSGAENVFVETKLFGIGTIEQVLNATNYSRSVKGLLKLAEALDRLLLEAFFEENSPEKYDDVTIAREMLQDVLHENSSLETQLIHEQFCRQTKGLLADIKEFIAKRCLESPLFRFWNNFLKIMQLIRDLIRADRTGDWLLHVQTVEKSQAIFHAMDRINYVRWGSIYLNDILGLERTHPDIYEEFMKGRFTVKHSRNSFSSVATDQALEQTINRSSKSSAGIIGSTLKKSFVSSWNLTQHEVHETTTFLRKVTGIKDNDELQVHHDVSAKRILKSEKDVQDIINFIRGHVNPFSLGEQPLRNIVTEELMPLDTAAELLEIFEVGCKKFDAFCTERFIRQSKTICNTIQKIKLPAFKPIKKAPSKQVKETKTYGKEANQIVELAREREYSLESLFRYELTMENGLFEHDGSMKRDKNKFSLIDELQTGLTSNDKNTSQQSSHLIIDVICICKELKWKVLKTFNDLLISFTEAVSREVTQDTKRIDFIFEDYSNTSVYTNNYLPKYSDEVLQIHKIANEIPVPVQDKKFWLSSENKILLQEYVRMHILTQAKHIWSDCEVICSATAKSDCQSSLSPRIFPDIMNDQKIEETSDKIVRHIKHATSESHSNITVKCNDPDLVPVVLHFWETYEIDGLKELRLKIRVGSKVKILPLHALAAHHGKVQCKVLPAAHFLTGSTHMSKIGTKKSALRSLPQNYLQDFGTDLSEGMIESSISKAEEYLVQVLKKNSSCKTFDYLRYTMNHNENTAITDLPPTSASIRLHILRAYHMTYLKRNLLITNENGIDPINFGYFEDEVLMPRRVTNLYPPIDQLVPNCRCTTCKTKACRCLTSQLPCIRFCKCIANQKCQNLFNEKI